MGSVTCRQLNPLDSTGADVQDRCEAIDDIPALEDEPYLD
jgi:hypothetical protein